MQVTVKSTKVLKSGEGDYGPWKLVKVATEEGTDYTTFADGAENLGSGAVITIENLDQDDKQRWSFKKYEVVSAGEPTQPKLVTSKEEENEYWERKQRIERESIEGQVAMKCNTELHIAGKWEDAPELLRSTIAMKLSAFAGMEYLGTENDTDPSSKLVTAKSSPSKASTKAIPKDVDMDWIKASLTELNWNPIEWYKETFEIDVKTVTDFMLKGNKLQRDKFTRELNDRLLEKRMNEQQESLVDDVPL